MKGSSTAAVVVAAVLFVVAIAGRFVGAPDLVGLGEHFAAGTFLILANLAMLVGIYLRMPAPGK